MISDNALEEVHDVVDNLDYVIPTLQLLYARYMDGIWMVGIWMT